MEIITDPTFTPVSAETWINGTAQTTFQDLATGAWNRVNVNRPTILVPYAPVAISPALLELDAVVSPVNPTSDPARAVSCLRCRPYLPSEGTYWIYLRSGGDTSSITFSVHDATDPLYARALLRPFTQQRLVLPTVTVLAGTTVELFPIDLMYRATSVKIQQVSGGTTCRIAWGNQDPLNGFGTLLPVSTAGYGFPEEVVDYPDLPLARCQARGVNGVSATLQITIGQSSAVI